MGTYGHVAFTSVGVPMRRAAKDIHPRDYAAYVPEAKKDGTWGSVVQLYAFAAVHKWTSGCGRKSATIAFASSTQCLLSL